MAITIASTEQNKQVRFLIIPKSILYEENFGLLKKLGNLEENGDEVN
jgi:hypothetical protein